ncbi:MAG: SpoIIE family protein phosphatase [Treponema sp.]|nr:SpoIIE family protein phosphatase [Treponema sp.]
MKTHKILIFTLLATLSFFTFNSCKKIDKNSLINLEDSFYWVETNAQNSPEQVASGIYDSKFQKLDNMKSANLRKLVGLYGNYIWLKAEIEIPEEYEDTNLAFYVQFIHYANKVWFNDHFLGEYGEFPPNEQSSMHSPQYYPIPKEFINKGGKNTLLIKVWCHGLSEISREVYIGPDSIIKTLKKDRDFFTNLFYMLCEGAFTAGFFIYFIMFLNQKNRKEYLSYSLICFHTTLFALIFFSDKLPLFNRINTIGQYLFYYKYLCCINAYFLFYFFASFMIYFLGEKQSKKVIIIRTILVGVQTITTVLIPTYNQLIKSCPYMIALSDVQLLFVVPSLIRAVKKRNKYLSLFILVLFQIAAGVIADVVLRGILNITRFPYFTYIGWISFNMTYLIILMMRFILIYKNNKYLTQNLQKEVLNQTSQIREANNKLEVELTRSKKDMEMASLVQKKLFRAPQRNFVGWDFAISYRPLQEVSGDMFDFYNIGSMLEGFSIFDVSGHGISAGLITMLSKNIISNSFNNSHFNTKTMAEVLQDINTSFIKAKGGADTYMTGILCSFSAIDINNRCLVQLANAGHPHPIFYSSLTNNVTEIQPPLNNVNFGAIGLTGSDVSYADISFIMEKGDVLVLFTDGLTESKNKEGKQFGKENLKDILTYNHEKTADQILKVIGKGLKAFTEGQELDDDITIVVLKREASEDYLEAIGTED